MQNLIKTGFIFLAIGLGLFFYKDAGRPLPISDHLDNLFFAMGTASLIIFAFVMMIGLITGKTYGLTKKTRCVRCGRKIKKGEVYCQFHQQELSSEFLTNLGEKRELQKRRDRRNAQR